MLIVKLKLKYTHEGKHSVFIIMFIAPLPPTHCLFLIYTPPHFMRLTHPSTAANIITRGYCLIWSLTCHSSLHTLPNEAHLFCFNDCLVLIPTPETYHCWGVMSDMGLWGTLSATMTVLCYDHSIFTPHCPEFISFSTETFYFLDSPSNVCCHP